MCPEITFVVSPFWKFVEVKLHVYIWGENRPQKLDCGENTDSPMLTLATLPYPQTVAEPSPTENSRV